LKVDLYNSYSSNELCCDMKMTGLTEPEFILQIPESYSVVMEGAVEIHIAVLSSLNHLKYYKTGYNMYNPVIF